MTAPAPCGTPPPPPRLGKPVSPPGKAPAGKAPPCPGKAGKAPPGKGSGRAPLGPPPKAHGSGTPARYASREDDGPKLRPLFWTTTSQAAPGSIWSDLGCPATFDKSQLERQFVLSAARSIAGFGCQGGSSARASSREPGSSGENSKRVRVLDDRTSQLLEIAFRKLPPPEKLASIVETLESFPDCLVAEAALALHCAATEQKEAIDQIKQLAVAESDLSQLDVPERYLWVLGSVPHCTAKLACGALLVGPASDLGDMRQCGDAVRICCQALRTSEMLRKCVSTSLAVGNVLNRGTSRAGAVGVVLPDSLLKLDELRGIQDSSENGEVHGRSILDFVTQALVDDSSKNLSKSLDSIRIDVEKLLAKVRCAQAVSLEEGESTCRKLCTQAQRAQQDLSQVQNRTSSCNYLAERVRKVVDEANAALKLVLTAKEEISKTQAWASVKEIKVKSSEWFGLWAQFLEQFLRALGRARPWPRPTQSMSFSMLSSPASTSRLLSRERHLEGADETPRAATSSSPCRASSILTSRRAQASTAGSARMPRRSVVRRLHEIDQDDENPSDVSDWEQSPRECSARTERYASVPDLRSTTPIADRQQMTDSPRTARALWTTPNQQSTPQRAPLTSPPSRPVSKLCRASRGLVTIRHPKVNGGG